MNGKFNIFREQLYFLEGYKNYVRGDEENVIFFSKFFGHPVDVVSSLIPEIYQFFSLPMCDYVLIGRFLFEPAN